MTCGSFTDCFAAGWAVCVCVGCAVGSVGGVLDFLVLGCALGEVLGEVLELSLGSTTTVSPMDTFLFSWAGG